MQRSQLRLTFRVGMTEDGKWLHKTKTFAIKPTATKPALLSVAAALASLQSAPLVHIQRADVQMIEQ